MREAPEAVVDAVQEQMGCHDHWVCPDAQRIADAAWAVAYPAALRDAADKLVGRGMVIYGGERTDAMVGPDELRGWADQAEFLDHANNPERTRERATDEIERERWNDNSNAR